MTHVTCNITYFIFCLKAFIFFQAYVKIFFSIKLLEFSSQFRFSNNFSIQIQQNKQLWTKSVVNEKKRKKKNDQKEADQEKEVEVRNDPEVENEGKLRMRRASEFAKFTVRLQERSVQSLNVHFSKSRERSRRDRSSSRSKKSKRSRRSRSRDKKRSRSRDRKRDSRDKEENGTDVKIETADSEVKTET